MKKKMYLKKIKNYMRLKKIEKRIRTYQAKSFEDQNK